MPDAERVRLGKRTTIVGGVGGVVGRNAGVRPPEAALVTVGDGGPCSGVAHDSAGGTDAGATASVAGGALEPSPRRATELAKPAPMANVVTNVRSAPGSRRAGPGRPRGAAGPGSRGT